MRMLFLGSWTLCACIALVTEAGSRGLPEESARWIRVESRHFTIVTDAERDRAVDVILTMERFRAFLAASETPGSAAITPTAIIAFKDEESFRPYKTKEDGMPDELVGRFTQTVDGNFIGISLDEATDWRGTVLHEYLHWIISQDGRIIPLWLNEGMAEFYSTFRVRNDIVEIGRPIEHHVRWLIGKPLIPLPELFTFRSDSKGYKEDERTGVFYAESWALYHFLRLSRPELFDPLNAFIAALRAGVNVNQAWQEHFELSYGQLEGELKSYVRSGAFPYQSVRVGDLGVDEELRVERLEYSEVLYSLGEYLAHVTPWQFKEAEQHLLAAVSQDPSHARAHVALASLYLDRGRQSEAGPLFRKAVDLAPEDEHVFFRWGMSELRAFQKEEPSLSMHPESMPIELAHAREMLLRCVAMNPSRAETFVGLGTTYLYDPGDPSEGIAALGVAQNLLPSRMDVVHSLVFLSLRAGDTATAQGLMDYVLVHSPTPEWPEAAQDAMYGYAVESFNEGDLDEATAILDWLEPRAREAELLDRSRSLRYEVEQRSQAQERQARHERRVDLYNRAVELANAGRVAEAVQILEELLPSIEQEEFAEAARRTLEQMREALRAAGGGKKP